MCFGGKPNLPPPPPPPPAPPPPAPSAMSRQPAPTSPEMGGLSEASKVLASRRGKRGLTIPLVGAGGAGISP